MWCPSVGATGTVQGRCGGRRCYLVSWRARVHCSCPWSQGCSPTVHLQIKLFLREPLEAKPGAGPGPAASQVASIRCPPGWDCRATNPRFMGRPACQGTRVDKAKLEFPSPGWFSLTFSTISHSWVSLSFLVSSVSHPLNLARSPLGSLLGL